MRELATVDRFFEKVQKTETCWLWIGGTSAHGYGRFKARSYRLVSAHRWSYEHHVGAIPEGLHIDHLCRVRNCVNPAHLEAVTPDENNARIPRATHCSSGHEFTAENTRIRARTASARVCRTCERRWSRELRARTRGLPDA